VAGIAAEAGLLPETIWNHPQNTHLRSRRSSMYALLDDSDEIYVPDPVPRQESVPVDRRTVFRRKGIPDILRLRMSDWQGKPRQGLKYLLEAGSTVRNGKTNEQGLIELSVPPGVRKGKLTLRNEWGESEEYELRLSHLDPGNVADGAQQRLLNLGFDCGDEYGFVGAKTHAALLKFQQANGLAQTGEPDSATLEALESLHHA